jgi:anti-sigma regulatory factor (Ser/Thr protein kinase)
MEQPYFQVSFRPNAKLVVSTVRRFTDELSDQLLDDAAMSAKVALATHELLENAVTYSSDGETEVRVEVEAEHVVVKTWNRASADRLTRLMIMIDEIHRAADPDELYQQALNRGDGTGLVRIRAKAEMTIHCEVTSDRVCVLARAPLRRTRGDGP